MPGFPVLPHLPEFVQTNVHWVGDAIQLSHPLLPPSPALILPRSSVFSNESTLRIRWPKYRNFIIVPSNEYSGLISFRIDWFELLTVQGTLKSLLQHHSLKASILWCSAFFMVQLSLEKGTAIHFSIFALRTPWTVWKSKKLEITVRHSDGATREAVGTQFRDETTKLKMQI